MEEEVKFESNPTVFLRVAFAVVTFATSKAYVEHLQKGPRADVTFELVLITVSVALTWVCYLAVQKVILIIFQKLPIVVHAQGMTQPNSFGKSQNIHWDSIAEVVRGIGCFALYTKGRKSRVLVPLYLKDQQGFYDYVCAHAPADNPLRVWIEASPERKGKVG